MNKKILWMGGALAASLLSAAEIHFPANADGAIQFAAKDMARCLSTVTGSQYQSKAAGNAVKGDIILAVNPKLRDQEWQFTTKEGKLYIEGCDAPGIVYGVYTFLEKYAKCAWLAPDTEILPKQPGWKLPELNEKNRPSFLRREMYVGNDYMDSLWRLRNKENNRASYINLSYGGPKDCHTFDEYVKFIKDPKLFGPAKGGGRCYTLCMTNLEVRKIVLDVLLKQIAKDRNPKRPRYSWPKIYDISQPDGGSGGECWCDGCRKIAEREGSYSGPNLDFVNYLAREVGKKYPDVFIGTFAYSYTMTPPKNMKAEPNVVIRYCAGWVFDPLLLPGTKHAKLLEEWGKHASHLSIWSYWRTYQGTLFPQMKKRSHIEQEIRLCKTNNVSFYYAEDEAPLSRSFAVFQHWLMLKMLEDSAQDINKLTDQFFAGYYGKGAPFIRKYLEYLESREEKSRTFLDKEFFEKSNAWFEQAEKAASGDKRSLTHIRWERVIVDRAMYDQLGTLLKSGYKFDKKAVAARFAANSQECLNAWAPLRNRAYAKLKAQKLENLKNEGKLYSYFPVETPKQFDGCDVVDLHWNQLNAMSCGGGAKVEFVNDPDAVCGVAVFNSKLDPKIPYGIGYYNGLKRQGGGITLAAADIPQDGKFHLYKLGRETIMVPLYIHYDGTWQFRSWLATIGIIPEERDIWVSMKFTGPRFISGSKGANRVLFDRVLLVKDPNPMRHYKPVDFSKNLVKNGGFEEYTSAGVPKAWARSSKQLFVDTKVKHSGKASMKVGKVEKGYAAIWLGLGKLDDLKDDLLIRGYLKYEGVAAPNFPFFGLWTLTGKWRNSYTVPVANFYVGNYDWQKFEKVISVEDLKRAAARSNPKPEYITLRLNLHNQPGTVWLDDLEVIPLVKK